MNKLTTFEEWIEDRWGGILTPGDRKHIIASLGLAGETGEVVELLKKHLRDGAHPGENIGLELGDLLHYLVVIARSYGWTLTDLAAANISKLTKRDADKRSAGETQNP